MVVACRLPSMHTEDMTQRINVHMLPTEQPSNNRHFARLENSINELKGLSSSDMEAVDTAAHADDQQAHRQERTKTLCSAVGQNSNAKGVESMQRTAIRDEVLETTLQTCRSLASGACTPLPKVACSRWVEAAKEGDTRELHRLLQQHTSLLNHQAGGLRCTALHWTAARGHADAMQHLLLWGADPCALTCTGCTPLFSAAGANQCKCVELLLMLPEVLQQLQWCNEDGLTPAAYALKHGQHLAHGILVQAAGGRAASYHGICRADGPETIADKSSSIQVQQAAVQGLRPGFLGPRPSKMQLLATADAANAAVLSSTTRGDDCTAQSHSAVGAGVAEDEILPSLQPLQQNNNSTPAATGQGSTPAAGEQYQQNATHVHSAHTDLGTCDDSMTGDRAAVPAAEPVQSARPAGAVHKQLGRAWLDAARAGDLQVMQAMLQAHPLLLLYSGAGTSYAFTSNTAAHWAAAKGHTAVLQWLLQQGSLQGTNICPVPNQAGATPLHTAAEHGQGDCARLLIICGKANVQQLDGLGQTAVHAAAANTATGGQQMAQLLLLWDLVQKLCSIDRSAWRVSTMQQLLKLAGKTSEAAACTERHELLGLAQAVVDFECATFKLLQRQGAHQCSNAEHSVIADK